MDAELSAAPDRELDARGLNCPLPILRTKKALTDMTSGQVLKILATDPGAVLRGDLLRFEEAVRLHALPASQSQYDALVSFAFNVGLGLAAHRAVQYQVHAVQPARRIMSGVSQSAMARGDGWIFNIAQAAAKACKVNLDTPWKDIPKDRQKKQGRVCGHENRGRDRSAGNDIVTVVRFSQIVENPPDFQDRLELLRELGSTA